MHVACRFSVPPGPSRRPKRDMVIENGRTESRLGCARRRTTVLPTAHLMLVMAGLSVDIIAPRLRASCGAIPDVLERWLLRSELWVLVADDRCIWSWFVSETHERLRNTISFSRAQIRLGISRICRTAYELQGTSAENEANRDRTGSF